MTLPDDISIERLARGVIDRTLPKVEWTHAGHFAAALWLCRHQPESATPGEIGRLITRYNEATKTPNTDTGGYHHTITLASMRAAADHLRRAGPDAPLALALGTLMASRLGHPDWLLAYWAKDTLFGVAARRAWVEPDLAPLPFR
jgi:hypothetical protein